MPIFPEWPSKFIAATAITCCNFKLNVRPAAGPGRGSESLPSFSCTIKYDPDGFTPKCKQFLSRPLPGQPDEYLASESGGAAGAIRRGPGPSPSGRRSSGQPREKSCVRSFANPYDDSELPRPRLPAAGAPGHCRNRGKDVGLGQRAGLSRFFVNPGLIMGI